MRRKRCYLVGAMEAVEDGGIGWRGRLIERIKDLPLSIVDPTANEEAKTGYELLEAKRLAFGWKRCGDWDKFNRMFDKIIALDLDCVRKSDFIVLYISPDHRVGGTVSELTLAWQLKIPVYCYLDGAVSDMNSWVLRLITKYGKIFRTWDELEKQIRKECK